MQRFGLFYTQSWYINLTVWEKELVRTSLELFAREERLHSSFEDYSFVVFPMAKAYEGFLKRLFYDLHLIDQRTFQDRHFRIGRALNPDLNPDRRDEFWIYGRLSQMCGKETARTLWNAWLQCRNEVFHYFTDNHKKLSLSEAGRDIELLAQAMDSSLQCEGR